MIEEKEKEEPAPFSLRNARTSTVFQRFLDSISKNALKCVAKAQAAMYYNERGLEKVGSYAKYTWRIVNFDIVHNAMTQASSRALPSHARAQYYRVDFVEAVEDFTKALNLSPAFAASFHNRGIIHYRMGRFPKAREDFLSAIEAATVEEKSLRTEARIFLGNCREPPACECDSQSRVPCA